VTASYSPPPRVDRCAGTTSRPPFPARGARAPSLSTCVPRPAPHLRRAAHRERPAYGGNERSPRALVDSGHVRSLPGNCSRVLVRKSPTGSTRLTGMQPRLAGRRAPATPPAPRLSRRGRSESLYRAFSGGCEYPVEEPPPSAPSKKRRRESRTGVSRLLASGPQQQVMRRTNPGQVGSALPHP
jgi:hypothetical protein